MAGTSATSPKAPTSPVQRTSPPAVGSPKTPTSPPAAGVLEAGDHHDNDADSILSSGSDLSETASVTSSIFKFREQYGRTYHSYRASEAEYFMPNDNIENERLDLQHNVLLLLQDNKLFISPAGKDKPMKRVLDAGCGTGTWTIEFAEEHRETSVVGVDLSPIQPTFVAPNVEFFIDDLELEWNFTNPFDFIMFRMLVGSIKDWPKLFGQAYQHLAPGGYIEVLDSVSPLCCDDGTMPDDFPALEWNKLLLEASIKRGAPLNSALSYKQQLIDAGFQNVVQVEYKLPISPWAKDEKMREIGAWNRVNILEAMQAATLMMLTNVLGWSVVEAEVLLVNVRKSFKDLSVHAYWPIYVVYGQKPE